VISVPIIRRALTTRSDSYTTLLDATRPCPPHPLDPFQPLHAGAVGRDPRHRRGRRGRDGAFTAMVCLWSDGIIARRCCEMRCTASAGGRCGSHAGTSWPSAQDPNGIPLFCAQMGSSLRWANRADTPGPPQCVSAALACLLGRACVRSSEKVIGPPAPDRPQAVGRVRYSQWLAGTTQRSDAGRVHLLIRGFG